ncbi:MAG: PIN domain protein [Promethearchaeota archaeon]|nr:MAG: PIN domain protein [Candidatus Lokiarchaeota archaeon]
MIYLDANVFVYAFSKPKTEQNLSEKIKWCKKEAAKIINDIDNEKEQYYISLIQLSEIVNILKYAMSWKELREFILGLISNDKVKILDVYKNLYINAVDKMGDYNMDSNDISAYLIMKKNNIKKIYTFDKHFRDFSDIECLPKIPDNIK